MKTAIKPDCVGYAKVLYCTKRRKHIGLLFVSWLKNIVKCGLFDWQSKHIFLAINISPY